MKQDRIWMAQFGWITFTIGILLMIFMKEINFAMVWLGSLALTGLVTGIILKLNDAEVSGNVVGGEI